MKIKHLYYFKVILIYLKLNHKQGQTSLNVMKYSPNCPSNDH